MGRSGPSTQWGRSTAQAYRLLLLDGTEAITLNGATSVTQEADGTLVFTGVPGGAATPDIGAATFVIWRAKDIYNSDLAITSTQNVGYSVKIIEDTAPALTTDTYTAVGIINNVAPASGTGFFVGEIYTGGDRNLRGARIVTGTTTATDAAALGATFDTAITHPNFKDGFAAGHMYANGYAAADLTTNLGQVSRFLSGAMTGDQYVFVAVGRTAATAGAVTVKVRAGYVQPQVYDLGGGFS